MPAPTPQILIVRDAIGEYPGRLANGLCRAYTLAGALQHILTEIIVISREIFAQSPIPDMAFMELGWYLHTWRTGRSKSKLQVRLAEILASVSALNSNAIVFLPSDTHFKILCMVKSPREPIVEFTWLIRDLQDAMVLLPPVTAPRACAVCGKGPKGLSFCSGCGPASSSSFYCSAAHQKAHWPSHKVVCKGVKAAGGGP